eukprot:960460-Amphidinium_carterae.1
MLGWKGFAYAGADAFRSSSNARIQGPSAGKLQALCILPYQRMQLLRFPRFAHFGWQNGEGWAN